MSGDERISGFLSMQKAAVIDDVEYEKKKLPFVFYVCLKNQMPIIFLIFVLFLGLPSKCVVFIIVVRYLFFYCSSVALKPSGFLYML